MLLAEHGLDLDGVCSASTHSRCMLTVECHAIRQIYHGTDPLQLERASTMHFILSGCLADGALAG